MKTKFRFRRLLHHTYVVTVIIHMVDAYLFTYVVFRCPVVLNATFCNNFCLLVTDFCRCFGYAVFIVIYHSNFHHSVTEVLFHVPLEFCKVPLNLFIFSCSWNYLASTLLLNCPYQARKASGQYMCVKVSILHFSTSFVFISEPLWQRGICFVCLLLYYSRHDITEILLMLVLYTNQSINQPIDQSTDQPLNQSTDQPLNQSTDCSINQSTNQSINQSIYQCITFDIIVAVKRLLS